MVRAGNGMVKVGRAKIYVNPLVQYKLTGHWWRELNSPSEIRLMEKGLTKQIVAGYCLVYWPTVGRPKELTEGLGVADMSTNLGGPYASDGRCV
jgi:hypothetical protein